MFYYKTTEFRNKISELSSGEKMECMENIIVKKQKEKMSVLVKNRKKFICKYCNKEIDQLNYNKWHGNNCKHKKLDQT